MIKSYCWSICFVGLLFVGSAYAEPVKLIYDTDMGNDVDDALALAMIHALESRGECELLAVTITKDQEECAPYIDAINTFYGRGNIPIGTARSGVTPQKSKFTGITREKIGDEYVFPHDLVVGDPVPAAVEVLRKTLAAQPDHSVVIAQVGFSTNLARLLDSKGDEYSKLSGKKLIAKKVRLISIMAGAFEPIGGRTHLEYNVIKDIPAAQKLASEWPTPIVWSGFEIGLAIRYPAVSIEQDFRYVDRHPIPESYQAYMPTPHERPTWDLTSILWAVRPDRGYFGMSETGNVSVMENGETTFEASSKGKHTYLILANEEIERIREIMASLASEPPQ
jgi:inosine-uridine nucleoside N-ribohydrolase